jgi:CBS domain-containing protein
MSQRRNEVAVTGGSAAITLFIADQVITVPPSATLLAAAEELAADGVGLLLVGTMEDVRGVISERDIVRAIGAGRDPAATVVDDVAHARLVWCSATATVHEAGLLMMTEYVRHVLVEDGGRLVGIVSARDLLGAYVADTP